MITNKRVFTNIRAPVALLVSFARFPSHPESHERSVSKQKCCHLVAVSRYAIEDKVYDTLMEEGQ